MPSVTGHMDRRSTNGGVKALKERTQPMGIKVGILKGQGEHPNADNATVAEIAFWNEFGTRNADGSIHIPERPAWRTTIKAQSQEYLRVYNKAMKAILLGKMKVKAAEARLGLQVQRDLKNAINRWVSPPNAPLTIAAKGADNPLEDTGHMRNSIHWASSKSGD